VYQGTLKPVAKQFLTAAQERAKAIVSAASSTRGGGEAR
jgi:hypothetical protein